MKTRFAIIAAAVVMTLGGCSIYKEYSRPETIDTDGLYGFESTDTTSVAAIGWRDFFRDTTLQRLIEYALENNRNLGIAAQRIVESEASLSVARLSMFPTLSFNPSASFAGVPGEGMASSFRLPLNTSWEVDLRGNLTNAKRAAKADYEQSLVYRQSVETELIASIARAYYTLEMLDSKLAISRQTATNWKENVRIMKAMKEAGMTNEASVAQTEANSCSIEASLYDLEYQIRQMENTLCLLAGIKPQHIARGQFDKSAVAMNIAAGIPAQLLSRRPDVMSAELDLRKAFYNTSAARSAFYPRITLNGEAGLPQFALSLGASLAQPIFNAGRNRANLKIAKARQEEALLAFEQTLLNAGAEVNDAIGKCHAADSKTDIRIRQIEDLQSAVTSTELLMHNSGATYLEVLTAQQSLLSARLLQISDQYDAIDGMISLYKALGGGAE